MRNFRRFRNAYAVFVCLAFTGAGVAWAEPTPAKGPLQADYYVENPYAPHRTTGSTARIGTAVGFLFHEPVEVTALGVSAAGGYRLWRFTFEAEYTYLAFQVKGPDDTPLGYGQRLGALARFDALRFGSKLVGQNSLMAIYVEGGVGTAWNHWYKPAYDEAARLVPVDTKRAEGLVGFGVSLDHRLQEPIGFPHRVAWFLGWRMSMSPHEEMQASICRGVSCKPVPMTTEERYVDRSMLFQSSLAFTF